MKSKTEPILENMSLARALGDLVFACSNPTILGETVSPGVRMPDKETLECARAIYHRYTRRSGTP